MLHGDRAQARSDGSAWGMVAALTALNVLSYLDRQLLVAVAPLLIEEFGLSKAQIGLLIGFAFMVVYAAGTLLLGFVADRVSRPRLVAGGLAGWSVATLLTGTASGFASLAAWRAGVGIGEATLPATAVSMIGDRLPANRAGIATSVFYSGISVGYGLSFVLAGALVPNLGWRVCFVALGIVGLAAVALVGRLPDPPRRGAAPAAEPGFGTAIRDVYRALASRPALSLLILGATLLVYASASSQHVITWLVEERGFEYSHGAFVSAAIVIAAGLIGNLGIGAVTDRASERHPGWRLVALAALGAAGLGAALVFYRIAAGSAWFFVAWFTAQCWLMGWFGAAMAAIDEDAPPGLRASVLGLGLLTVNVVGVASGAWITGLIGDRQGLTSGLTWSLLPAAAGVALIAAAGVSRLRRASAQLPNE